ncbi:DUF4082 domain-containing protein [Nubsella zeaxanthinifaciens]|uniref:DUF4082 domain-containing protein n=1 Tax=Nubsella zeaxanthinifaciens TaxID=392412 RepID=UPI001300AC6C|nr:DUF4082 domain-containing protein [Nubsella zeaxanthinifaciens]
MNSTSITIRSLILSVVLFFTISSCKKKDDQTPAANYPEENPLTAFLATTGLNQNNVSFTNPTSFEMGFGFKPKVKGVIKGITVKLPYVNSSLKVTIWEKATANAIKTVYVNVPNADQEVSVAIADLELVKNAEYVLSINSNKFYNHRRTDIATIVYPVDAGNISITGSYTSSTNPVTIPSNVRTIEFTGDYSFIFKQTE